MTSDVINISEFRFRSLRQFMQPLYAELKRHIEDPEEEKKGLIRAIIPRFFQRLRLYRKVTLEMIAERANRPVADVERFEAGQMSADSNLEHAYCQLSCGFHERDFFGRRIYEFRHPSMRSSKESIALDALKRFGIVLPDVDYPSLGAPKGKLLSFPPKHT